MNWNYVAGAGLALLGAGIIYAQIKIWWRLSHGNVLELQQKMTEFYDRLVDTHEVMVASFTTLREAQKDILSTAKELEATERELISLREEFEATRVDVAKYCRGMNAAMKPWVCDTYVPKIGETLGLGLKGAKGATR